MPGHATPGALADSELLSISSGLLWGIVIGLPGSLQGIQWSYLTMQGVHKAMSGFNKVVRLT